MSHNTSIQAITHFVEWLNTVKPYYYDLNGRGWTTKEVNAYADFLMEKGFILRDDTTYPSTWTIAVPAFAYLVYTVNDRRLTGQTVVWGTSADQVADAMFAKGYRTVEVAPAAPVNGFKDMPYKSGDTAKRGI